MTEIRLVLLAGACLLLLSLGFAGGHRWQAGEVADAERAQAAAEAERDKWKQAAAGYKRATAAWQATVDANAREGKRLREEGQAAVAELARQQAAAKREAAAWRERFARAQRDPDCAALTQATACPAFRDY
jgi:hypothetical protein